MVKMVLDFSKVKYLSSAALRQLIALKKRLDKENGEVKLSCIAPDILTVFKTTQLDKVFDIHPSAQAAVNRFQKKKWKLF
jgi:anti-sigma B factor antagonist